MNHVVGSVNIRHLEWAALWDGGLEITAALESLKHDVQEERTAGIAKACDSAAEKPLEVLKILFCKIC